MLQTFKTRSTFSASLQVSKAFLCLNPLHVLHSACTGVTMGVARASPFHLESHFLQPPLLSMGKRSNGTSQLISGAILQSKLFLRAVIAERIGQVAVVRDVQRAQRAQRAQRVQLPRNWQIDTYPRWTLGFESQPPR